MKSGELAGRLYVSPSLIRHWSGEFAEFLSDAGSGIKPGATREFNQQDQLVMASIRALRDEGYGYDEIREKLRDGWRLEELPAEPEQGLASSANSPAPIRPEQYRLVLQRLVDKDERIAELEDQLRQERNDREALYERIIKETEARARLEGEIRILREQGGKRRRWWQRGEQ